MRDDEFGPWQDHDGQTVPVPNGTVCLVQYRAGVRQIIRVDDRRNAAGNCFIRASVAPEWSLAKIVRYRVRKPKGLRVLQALVADPPPLPFDLPCSEEGSA